MIQEAPSRTRVSKAPKDIGKLGQKLSEWQRAVRWCPQLTTTERLVALELIDWYSGASFRDAELFVCWPSVATMSRNLSIPISTIRSARARLTAVGMIEPFGARTDTGKTQRFLFSDDWLDKVPRRKGEITEPLEPKRQRGRSIHKTATTQKGHQRIGDLVGSRPRHRSSMSVTPIIDERLPLSSMSVTPIIDDSQRSYLSSRTKITKKDSPLTRTPSFFESEGESKTTTTSLHTTSDLFFCEVDPAVARDIEVRDDIELSELVMTRHARPRN